MQFLWWSIMSPTARLLLPICCHKQTIYEYNTIENEKETAVQRWAVWPYCAA